MRRIIGFLVNFAVIATLVSVGGPLTLSADDDRVQNCLDILIAFPGASDGEYFIEPREDQKFMIYCHDMASGNPRQYLTLINTGFPSLCANIAETPSYLLISEQGGKGDNLCW